jgi:hypothetical protein
MKAIQRVLIALTLVNLGLLIFVLVRIQPNAVQGVAPVLRGRALEIVDGQGRVRASCCSPRTTGHGHELP